MTHDLVEKWRLDSLERLGFSSDEISALMAWGTDLHEAQRLVRGGCPTDLAVRILAPLDGLSYGEIVEHSRSLVAV